MTNFSVEGALETSLAISAALQNDGAIRSRLANSPVELRRLVFALETVFAEVFDGGEVS